jgi:aldehyde dehydrogenase (NAD+)
MTSITRDRISADPAAGQTLSMYIDGAWVPARSGRVFASIDASTGNQWLEAPSADAGDVDIAVAAATAAMRGDWGSLSGTQRGRLLYRLADLVEGDAGR